MVSGARRGSTTEYVTREGEHLQQRRLTDEHQVVGAGEVLAEQAQLAQAVGLQEVGVVDDGHEHFAGAVQAEGLLHEQALALAVAARELDLEGLAENAQGVGVAVQGPVNHRGDHPLGVEGEERLLEEALAGARFAQDQAKAALLGVDLEDLEDFLLMGEQRERVAVEGVFLQAEMGTDHGRGDCGRSLGRRSLATKSSGRASPRRSPL